jgi:uncharacterized glyoxalase superfamily protein PhnB
MSVAVITPSIAYREPMAAMDWLGRAFGFDIALLLTDANGNLAHAEMSYCGAHIGVMGEWSSADLLGPAKMRSPKSLDHTSTGFLWISVEDIDSHCARARSAGATIVQEPADQPYGARTYRAIDCDGHVWCFRQTVAEISNAEFERITGLRYRVPLGE